MDKRKRVQRTCEFFSDLGVLIISTFIGLLVSDNIFHKVPEFNNDEWLQYFIILAFSYVIIFFSFSTSINLDKRSKRRELISVLRNSIFTYMLFSAMLLLIKNPIIASRYLFVISLFSYIVLSSCSRYVLKRLLTRSFMSKKIATLIGVVTISERAENFITSLQEDWSKKIVGVSLVDAACENDKYYISEAEINSDNSSTITIKQEKKQIEEISGVPVVANIDNFMDWIRSASVDEVYINIPYLSAESLNPYIDELEDMGITVHINLPVLEQMIEQSKFDNIRCNNTAGYPMATFYATHQNSNALSIKRIVDIIGSIIGIIISIPLIILVSIPLLIESPGGLFFKQERVGKNGRVFNIYKLRSMYNDAEKQKSKLECDNEMSGLMFKMDNDPRITKVGKFIRKTSIDELPQFINVLRGDMSLVGTRPPTLEEFEQYESHHKRRLSMRPGITGMWQVSGRSEITDFEDVVSLDCEYIDNWSLLLDMKILLKTFPAVFNKKGAK